MSSHTAYIWVKEIQEKRDVFWRTDRLRKPIAVGVMHLRGEAGFFIPSIAIEAVRAGG